MPDFHNKFLQAEERATARLMGFYEEARIEIEFLLRSKTESQLGAVYRTSLRDEIGRIIARAERKARAWANETIPAAYEAGHSTHSSVVVPVAALEALTRNPLALIRSISDDVRTAVRSSIAAGILQGLTPGQIRDRIIAGGLTNIPHWPSVEYRAGVIARTETMGAYNAGVDQGMADSGALYAEWIASPDEATCSICLPRDSKVYRIGDPPAGADPYPDAKPMPKRPAHPRCRCTARAVFRDPDGNVIRQGTADVDPKLPTDAMGGDMPAKVPASIGEIDAECNRRWAQADREGERVSNSVLGLADGRTIGYANALNGRVDEHGHIVEIFGRPPNAARGGDLAGFENRQKKLPSFIRKVRALFELEGAQMAPAEAADSIGDLFRYTYRFNDGEYTDSTLSTVRRMRKAGYKLTKWKPSWDSDVYRGVNTNWQTPDGTVFELQFHTPESFQAKEINHGLYEQERELPKGDPKRDALNEQMSDRMKAVPKPPGWERLMRMP